MNQRNNAVGHDELLALLRCVCCRSGKLDHSDTELKCRECGEVFPFRGKHPVLLQKENCLFPQVAYLESSNPIKTGPQVKSRMIFRMIPSRSVNVCRTENLLGICKELGSESKLILVIGSGSQAIDIINKFEGSNARFVFCDIAKGGDVDVYCDAHELPFADGSVDGLITTAVMEHVLYPEVVADEIVRVVKQGGFVYSEIPFLQAVHMGAYDFTRFTLSGHRRLYEEFSEVSSGMVAGAGTALIWSLEGFARSFFKGKRTAKLAAMGTRTLFFWLKYFDYWFKDNRQATDFASATFYYGKKSKNSTSPTQIVDAYNR